jgi:hypothetical protein
VIITSVNQKEVNMGIDDLEAFEKVIKKLKRTEITEEEHYFLLGEVG